MASRSGFHSSGAFGPDDESLRGRADEIERVTRNQRQARAWACRRAPRHRRASQPSTLDPVDLLSVVRFEFDDVTGADVLEAAEEAVPVAGNPDIPVRAGQRRVSDVSDGAMERDLLGAWQHRHLETDRRDSQDADRRRPWRPECSAPGSDALGTL